MRIGLIGFGAIAEHGHLPALQSLPDGEVVAIADLSPDRRELARAVVPDARAYSTPVDLIQSEELDVVDICTPPSTHLEFILAACEKQIPYIVSEKPFVLSEADYAVISTARRTLDNRVISINNWMHSDLNRHVATLLDEGAIGRIESVVLRTGRPDVAKGNAGWLPRWRTDPLHAGGGIILDHGWHQLYLLLGWVAQPVIEVRATMRVADRRHFPVEDEASVDLQFADAHGRIELSWTASERSNDGIIRGDRGEIAIYDDRVVLHNGSSARTLPFNSRLTESSYHPEWFEAVFRDNVVNKDRSEADRNFREAGALVSIVGAAYRSAAGGGIPLPTTLPDEVFTQV